MGLLSLVLLLRRGLYLPERLSIVSDERVTERVKGVRKLIVRKLGESIRKSTLPLSLWKVEFHILGVVFWNCRPEVRTKDYVCYFKHEETSSLCFSCIMN